MMINNLPTYQKMGGVIATLASLLAISDPAQALTFTTFTDEAAFITAAGSLSTETFNSFVSDASFNNGATVNLTDFSLTGFGNTATQNTIDASPFFAAGLLNVNGTTYVLGNTNNGVGFNTTFNSPISAFGATFDGISDGTGITRLRVGSDIVANIPAITRGFFGFTASGNFTTLTFESASNVADSFGADNFLYSSATPVPFEFNPVLGLGVLGVAWVVKMKLIKKAK